ncbi:unnamed protein product [Parnassius mnemosyne]|uniref:PiggyBac transposable element-derived protein domain-containing protein n=1 Tax=Parnassius mnemosyne TaxID=213953 RepID=A0AAV1LXQ3_9NEOP
MGIVKLPKLVDYWSTDPMITQSFARKFVARNRFEILLQMVQFKKPPGDRLYTSRSLIDSLNLNFNAHYYLS